MTVLTAFGRVGRMGGRRAIPAFVAETSLNGDPGTQPSCSVPAGAVGDLILLFFSWREASAPTIAGFTDTGVGFPPAAGGGNEDSLYIFKRIADGTEGATVSTTGAVGGWGITMLRYRPASGGTILTSAGSSGVGVGATAPSVSPSKPGRLITVARLFPPNTVSWPGSMASRGMPSLNNFYMTFYIADEALSAAGATGTRTLSWSAGSTTWRTLSMVI